MKNERDFHTMMQSKQTPLSETEVSIMWQNIAHTLPLRPQPSPYKFSFIQKYSIRVSAVVCMIVLSLGGAGTYVAAEQAKPGEFLFALEQAIEDVRLSLANDTRAEDLRTQFAEKRLREIQALIEAELVRLSDTTSSVKSVSATTTVPIRVEATVYTDTTVVKVEMIDQVVTFLTTGASTAAIAEEVSRQYGGTVEELRKILDINVSNRPSYPSERGTGVISNQTQSHIEIGMKRIMNLLNGVQSTSTRTEILTNLSTNVDNLRVKSDREEYRFRVREDGSSRIVPAVTTVISDDVRSSIANRVLDEVYVEVFSDYTLVEIDFETGPDIVFQTLARTPETVTQVVAERIGLSPAVIWSALDFEFKGQSNRSNDDWDYDEDVDDWGERASARDRRSSATPRDRDERNETAHALDSQGVSNQLTIKKIEVDVDDGRAEVEVEYRNDESEIFFLAYVTTETLLQTIADRLAISVAEVDALLDLDYERD